ncbi:hypothetical protein BT96DRAFT_978505 [Gymnopus androsaceus JB14]|uniref:F-box domain-containing protein n=1 Tax=Gymnopus androsaceus JB14 TaxID=1447944 RepID=A0A6A4H9K3_9AGAR|nr:hypothetical protein BT96DRAFT_978505 [Gymnopus androsaceus JB14]
MSPGDRISSVGGSILRDRYAVRDLTEAPLLLISVSREWRETAINTPTLWKSLHIFIPSKLSPEAVQRRTIGSSIWLERSGSLPLSISLCLETLVRQIQNENSSDGDRIMATTLLKFDSRVQELTFSGPGSKLSEIANHLEQTSSHNFPLLSMFCVRITKMANSRDLDLPFASLVRQMPILNNLAMINFIQHGRAYVRLELGWENLTELTLHPPIARQADLARFSPGEILNILGRTRRLQSVTLSIDISYWDHASTAGTTVVNLLALSEIRLIFLHFSYQPLLMKTFFPNFFRSIVCPSLKTLYVSWQGANITDVPFSALVSLQGLETLSLDMPLTPNALLQCLSLVPNLSLLEIVNRTTRGDELLGIPPSLSESHTVDNSVLTCLGSASGETNHTRLCPGLQHIRIIFKDNFSSSITYNALLAFLESRIQMKMLQSCDIYFPEPQDEPTEEEARRLQALVDSGLKLRIRCGSLDYGVRMIHPQRDFRGHLDHAMSCC